MMIDIAATVYVIERTAPFVIAGLFGLIMLISWLVGFVLKAFKVPK